MLFRGGKKEGKRGTLNKYPEVHLLGKMNNRDLGKMNNRDLTQNNFFLNV